ncbi:hypothetical protein NONO_c75840 [Nocardia nova SH22a]|uniref:Pycsar effector protein domain-containing protein n=1 Tax=Nocardia nova SH22a TaxID=1415166 RepID=W5TT11_9NOCA|nr:Pycsar system effector family protein [Nocardia nova]AHH22339.1 hypothetical protein NONO_c75840 [Nocardia nova SH22a]
MIGALARLRATITDSAPEPHVDDAWRLLTMILELLKHAETKAVAALATAGVLGQLLLSVVRSASGTEGATQRICLVLAAVAIAGAAICAAAALRPRLGARRGTTNPLYFGHITAGFGFSRESYAKELTALTRDPETMSAQLAAQIWENAAVARRKFLFATIAVWCLLLAILLSAAAVCLAVAQGAPVRNS